MGTTYAASKLMQLRKPQFIGSINNDCICRWNINTGFYDSRTDKNIVALVIKICHHLFKLALSHLAMRNPKASMWNQIDEFLGCFFNGFYIIVKVIDLPCTH